VQEPLAIDNTTGRSFGIVEVDLFQNLADLVLSASFDD